MEKTDCLDCLLPWGLDPVFDFKVVFGSNHQSVASRRQRTAFRLCQQGWPMKSYWYRKCFVLLVSVRVCLWDRMTWRCPSHSIVKARHKRSIMMSQDFIGIYTDIWAQESKQGKPHEIVPLCKIHLRFYSLLPFHWRRLSPLTACYLVRTLWPSSLAPGHGLLCKILSTLHPVYQNVVIMEPFPSWDMSFLQSINAHWGLVRTTLIPGSRISFWIILDAKIIIQQRSKEWLPQWNCQCDIWPL